MKIPILFTRSARGSASYLRRRYFLYDDFTTARAAGAINGTQAEPVGGTRTVNDANGKISIAGGLLEFVTGGVANDWVYWNESAFTHTAGRVFRADISARAASSSLNFGYDLTAVASTIHNGFRIGTTTIEYVSMGAAILSIPITNTPISLAVLTRAAGFFYFAKGGGLTKWTLINYSASDAGLNIPEIQRANTTADFDVSLVKMPKRYYSISPYTSDGFSGAATDGNGVAEGGASGLTYTAVGTWGVSGGACSCSALSGGLGFRYLATSSPDVIVDSATTRAGGVIGVVARYEDANNYIIAYHDGTNLKIDKVVAGVTTNLSSQARTYAAGASVRLTVRGTSAVAQYNTLTSVVVTVPASTSVNHGLYTTDTGNTFDNFQVWPTGAEGQYEPMDNL